MMMRGGHHGLGDLNMKNKQLCHERLYPKNKVLHLMFYYELKLN
jgi:hypothetical protein